MDVQYLLVGGTAVAFHGYLRPTTTNDGRLSDRDDFDFWYNPRYLNYQRLLTVLENLGLDLTDVRREDTFNLKQSFFRHHFEDFTIDFIPKIGGDLSFSECNKRRHAVPIGEIEVFILSLTDLIMSKKATGRKKDLHDVEALERIQKNSLGS